MSMSRLFDLGHLGLTSSLLCSNDRRDNIFGNPLIAVGRCNPWTRTVSQIL